MLETKLFFFTTPARHASGGFGIPVPRGGSICSCCIVGNNERSGTGGGITEVPVVSVVSAGKVAGNSCAETPVNAQLLRVNPRRIRQVLATISDFTIGRLAGVTKLYGKALETYCCK